jgi:hypothetical protein
MFSFVGVIGASIALSDCDGCDYPIKDEKGAEIVVDGTIEAGKPAAVAIYGQVGKGDKCPTSLRISYDEPGTPGLAPEQTWRESEAITAQRVDEDAPQSAGKPCRLVAKGRALTVLARGNKPRRVEITAAIHVKEENEIRRSTATKTVTVNPPGGRPPAPQPVAANPPAGPVARIVVDRAPIVREASNVFLDGRASYDPDGSIAKYEWDLDGNGVYDHTGPEVQTTPDPGSAQLFRLRVTDNSGLQTETTRTVPVVGAGQTVFADPNFGPHDVRVGNSYAVDPVEFINDADKAELDWDGDSVVEQTLTGDLSTQTFTSRAYAAPGSQVQSVRYSVTGNPALAAATYYRVATVTPAARAGIAAKAKKLTVSLNSGNVKIKRRGRLTVGDNGFRIKGMRVTGKGRGGVPKGTPKSLRGAFKALTSGRYAAALDGTANLLGRRVVNSGKAIVLVRSSKSRRTQVCLGVTQPAGGGPGRVAILGATGKAKGLTGKGVTPPAIVTASGRPVFDTAVLSARKGKGRGLSRGCRALARDLDGKKAKKKRRKG